MSKSTFVRVLIGVIAVLLCCGCNVVPIAEDLSQDRVNEIIVLLKESGISATVERGTGGGAKYSISVRREHFLEAHKLIFERGLLKKDEAGFAELTAPAGWLPNSREIEALRLDRALAAELEEALQAHPQVLSARVIVRMNYRESAAGEPAVAAVLLERSENALDPAAALKLIQTLFPGVPAEHINLVVTAAPGSGQLSQPLGVSNIDGKIEHVPLVKVFYWHIAEGEKVQFVAAVLGFLLVTGIVGGMIGYLFGFYRQSKSLPIGDLLPEGGSGPVLKYDRLRRNLPEN